MDFSLEESGETSLKRRYLVSRYVSRFEEIGFFYSLSPRRKEDLLFGTDKTPFSRDVMRKSDHHHREKQGVERTAN